MPARRPTSWVTRLGPPLPVLVRGAPSGPLRFFRRLRADVLLLPCHRAHTVPSSLVAVQSGTGPLHAVRWVKCARTVGECSGHWRVEGDRRATYPRATTCGALVSRHPIGVPRPWQQRARSPWSAAQVRRLARSCPAARSATKKAAHEEGCAGHEGGREEGARRRRRRPRRRPPRRPPRRRPPAKKAPAKKAPAKKAPAKKAAPAQEGRRRRRPRPRRPPAKKAAAKKAPAKKAAGQEGRRDEGRREEGRRRHEGAPATKKAATKAPGQEGHRRRTGCLGGQAGRARGRGPLDQGRARPRSAASSTTTSRGSPASSSRSRGTSPA